MDAQLCRMKRPGWAKACYLQGAAQMLLKVRWNIYTFPSTNSFSPPNPYLFFDAVTLISSGLWKGMWCISRWSQTGSSKCWDWQSIVVKSSLSFSEDLFCKYKLSLVSIILSIARIDFIRLCSHLFERLRISLLNYAFICYFVTLRRLPLESPGESCAIKALSVIGVFCYAGRLLIAWRHLKPPNSYLQCHWLGETVKALPRSTRTFVSPVKNVVSLFFATPN